MIDRISPTRLDQLRRLIDAGREDAFYWWPEWEQLREDVLRLDNRECQLCKARGRYGCGTIVHHVRHLRDCPELALSVFDPDTGARQLITVCKSCHEEEHPEALRRAQAASPPLTEERWD